MIQEDYVSFETARLLEERGFDEYCHKSYFKMDKTLKESGFSEWERVNEIKAPTQSLAIKWLRLKHNIYIDVHLSFTEDPEAYPAVYYVYILDAKSGNSLLKKAAHIGELNPLMDVNDHNVPITFNSPEEAVEAAIKYCLENLIKP